MSYGKKAEGGGAGAGEKIEQKKNRGLTFLQFSPVSETVYMMTAVPRDCPPVDKSALYVGPQYMFLHLHGQLHVNAVGTESRSKARALERPSFLCAAPLRVKDGVSLALSLPKRKRKRNYIKYQPRVGRKGRGRGRGRGALSRMYQRKLPSLFSHRTVFPCITRRFALRGNSTLSLLR